MTWIKAIFCLSICSIYFFCAPTSLPAASYSGDIIGYCKKVSDASGGSYSIEQGCREMEQEAKDKLAGMNVPSQIMNYCRKVADVSGKSYSIMVGCIEMELEAKSKL